MDLRKSELLPESFILSLIKNLLHIIFFSLRNLIKLHKIISVNICYVLYSYINYIFKNNLKNKTK